MLRRFFTRPAVTTVCAWLALVAVCLVAALAFPSAAHAVTSHAPVLGPLGLVGIAGMVTYNWQGAVGGPVMSRDQLEMLANPRSANQNEVFPHILYDTQSIPTATAGPFTFFQAIQNDKTLGNVPGPGQLPDPYYFIIQYVACDFLIIPFAGTAAAFAPWSDAAEILINQRATFSMVINDKTYGPYPLASCHGLGGINPYGVLEGATADPGKGIFSVNVGAPGSGGYYVGGGWTIGPKVGYSLAINTAAAPTITTSPVRVRMSLVGTLYRAVR